MIYTLTLNPAVDITVSTSSIRKDAINKSVFRSVSAGGKGFNTSRALNCLGFNNIAIAFCGGFFGEDIIKILKKDRITTKLLTIKDSIRVNLKIIEEESKRLVELNEEGPEITEKEIADLMKELEILEDDIKYFVISGSLPAKNDPCTYKNIIEILKSKKITTILDTSGEPLYHGLSATPDIVKINMSELSHMSSNFFKKDPEQVIASLLSKGTGIVMITDGANAAKYYDRTGRYSAKPPVVSGKYTTGAGDSVNAGLIYAMEKGMDTYKTIKFALACGSSNILSEIPGAFDPKDVKKLMPDIKVKKVDI